jgi:hypothetical protein
VKKTQISGRKLSEDSSEEDGPKEMCDNEASDDEKRGFGLVKCSDESKQLRKWIQRKGKGQSVVPRKLFWGSRTETVRV